MRACRAAAVACCFLLFLAFAPRGSAEGLRDRLKGLVYEVEEYTEPKDAWAPDRSSPNKWNLWSTEEDVINKRSGGRSLQSPRVEKDRATPEEGAPPLHTRITGIPKGTYHAYVSPPNRRIAISFDGKNWEMREGGEIHLGVVTITDGTFELWVDDRYASPTNIGSCYYDYIRFEEFAPPKLSHFAAFPALDAYERLLGAGFRRSGVPIQLSWITDTPVPTGTVEYGRDGRLDARVESKEISLRNHRVVLPALAPGRYQARVRIGFGKMAWASPAFAFTVPGPEKPGHAPSFRIPLTVTEPTASGRKQWPVTSGVPLPRGAARTTEGIVVLDAAGKPVPSRCAAASAWPDGSIRWLVVTFLADTDPSRPARYMLVGGLRRPVRPVAPPIRVAANMAEEGFALFRDLGLDADGNGKIGVDEVFTGAPELGNLRLIDAEGKTFGMAPGAKVRSFRDALRREALCEGSYTGPDGGVPLAWRAEVATFAGQPWMRLRFSILNPRVTEPHVLLSGVGLSIPIAGAGPVEGAFDGRPYQRVEGEQVPVLLQDKDDRFVIQGQGAKEEGEHSLGFASVRRDDRCLTAFVRDFWQTYPKGFALKPDGLHVRLLPLLPPNAFEKESADSEALVRLYYPYRKGKYQFNRSLAVSTEVYVLLERGASAGDPARLKRYAEWFQNPLFAAADPAATCGSGALGPVGPQQPGRFDAYERLVEKGFASIENNRLKKREYGWMNYGDWHGERHFNWGNLEYDLQWALALHFLRTGDLKYLWRGEQAARHSTTVDTVHYPWGDRMAGLQWTHCVGHIGGFFDRTDERFRKLGNVFGLANPEAPNPFVAGTIDVGGHTFTAGNLLYGMLLGDPRMVEVTERIAGAQAAYLTPNFRFGIERAAGWPIINAMEAYETTGNPFFLNAARLYVEKVLAQQDPTIGDFRMGYGPPECLCEPRHIGGKAFATGVLLYGLMRYHLVTQEPAVKTCIVRSAKWLARDSWNAETHAFRYISTCPRFDKPRGNGATDLLVAPGMAYALTLQPDAQVRDVLLDSLSRALAAGVGDGKGYAGLIRQMPYALHLLERLGVKDLQPPAGTAGVSARVTLHVAPGASAPLTLYLIRDASMPAHFEARVKALPAGWKAQPERITAEARVGVSAAPGFRVSADRGAAPGDLVVAYALGGKPAGEVKVRLAPQAPPALAPAADASGIAVIGPADNPTTRALASLPGVQTGVAPDAITRFRAVVLACDYFATGEKPGPLMARLSAYALGGGTLVLFQLNDDIWQPGLLPLDLMLSDANGEVGKEAPAAHPLFEGVGSLRTITCYDTITCAGPEWKVLARDSAGGPAILEAAIGRGRILVVEPSLDRIASGAEAPPDGVSADDCRRFIANLARWAVGN